MDEISVDISHDWTFNSQGDLNIVSDADNIVQAISNRLNTYSDELDTYYIDYGSVLSSYLGWLAEEDTLEFMKIELESVLDEDSRLTDHNVELSLNEDNSVKVDISVSFGDGSEVELSLTTNEEGVFIEV